MSEHVITKRTRYAKAHPHTYRCSCGWGGPNRRTDREAVRDTREHLALLAACPTCSEPPGQWCMLVGGKAARFPGPQVADRIHTTRLPEWGKP